MTKRQFLANTSVRKYVCTLLDAIFPGRQAVALPSSSHYRCIHTLLSPQELSQITNLAPYLHQLRSALPTWLDPVPPLRLTHFVTTAQPASKSPGSSSSRSGDFGLILVLALVLLPFSSGLAVSGVSISV